MSIGQFLFCLFVFSSIKRKKKWKEVAACTKYTYVHCQSARAHKSRPLKSHCQKSVKGTRADVAANN